MINRRRKRKRNSLWHNFIYFFKITTIINLCLTGLKKIGLDPVPLLMEMTENILAYWGKRVKENTSHHHELLPKHTVRVDTFFKDLMFEDLLKNDRPYQLKVQYLEDASVLKTGDLIYYPIGTRQKKENEDDYGWRHYGIYIERGLIFQHDSSGLKYISLAKWLNRANKDKAIVVRERIFDHVSKRDVLKRISEATDPAFNKTFSHWIRNCEHYAYYFMMGTMFSWQSEAFKLCFKTFLCKPIGLLQYCRRLKKA